MSSKMRLCSPQLKLVLLLLILMLTSIGPLSSQPNSFWEQLQDLSKMRFQTYNVEQGMPSRISIRTFQDSRGYIWVTTEEGLARFDGLRFKNYFFSSADSASIRHNHVAGITEDHNGYLWLATHGGGLNRFDPRTGQFREFFHERGDDKNPDPYRYRCLYYDEQENCIWVGGISIGLLRFDLESKSFDVFHPEPLQFNWRTGNTIYSIVQDPYQEDRLWLAAFGKLYAFYKTEKRFAEHTAVRECIHQSSLQSLVVTAPEELWIGTWANGLLRYNPQTSVCKRFLPRPEFQPQENQNINTAIAIKSAEELWVSDHHLGLGVFNTRTEEFSFLGTADAPFPCLEINHIFKDQDHNLWLTSDNGLYQAPLQLQPFPSLSFNNYNLTDFAPLPNGHILVARKEKEAGLLLMNSNWQTIDTIPWAGSYPPLKWVASTRNKQYWTASGDHLYEIDWQNRRLRRAVSDLLAQLPNQDFSLSDIVADPAGDLWLTTYDKGVIRINAERTQATQYLQSEPYPAAPAAGLAMTGITVAPDSTIWVGTSDGLLIIDPQHEHFQWMKADTQGLLGDWVRDITLDSLGHIWMGTNTGVQAIDHCTRRPVLTLQREQGLPRSNVHQLATDRYGRVWMGTYEGLAYYDWGTGQIKTINRSNGLRYPTETRVITCGPFILSGTSDKKNLLHIDSLERPLSLREVSLQQFIVNGHPEQLSPGIDFRKAVTLSHDENFLEIHFAAPSYFQPKRLQYRYQLKGLDTRWRYTDGRAPRAIYTGLPPGQYTFKVQVRAPEASWPEKRRSLSIVITPPWWANSWAYAGYLLLLCGLLYAFYRQQLNRQMTRQRRLQEQEIEALRSRLYANMTHEFRTPLTVIAGMAEHIREQPEQWLQSGVEAIQRNTQRLLRLVNQLLDLSRLDSKSLPVTLIQGDVVSFLRYLTEAFQSYAEAQEILLSYQAGAEQLMMDYDPKKLEAIYTNLLSNALKFTPAGGQVDIKVQQVERQQQPYCQICITDTGPGISAAQQDFIFNRFYQADDSSTRPVEGSGIGLALTKEFVHLLGGMIEVHSLEGEGASFRVLLPLQRNAQKQELTDENTAVPLSASMPNGSSSSNPQSPLVLLVEDNPDVATYLHACLKADYQLAFAQNGQEGIEQARKLVPDIIISDVMMPLKNGFELCETLKHDTRTSHIPILLLTARADKVSRHTGLRTGADAYLTKPFNRQELNIRLQKMVELRQRLKVKYSMTQLQPKSTAPPEDPEVMFLQKLRAIILEQLSNPNFRVEPDLCRAIAMSRPQLYRKLKALTGLSPSAFLRQLRMQEARRLLQTGQYTAQLVAEKTGFQDASYFSKAYQREIGESPQETISPSKSNN